MKDIYCMYCGEKLTKDDHLEGCCNDCGDKQEYERYKIVEVFPQATVKLVHYVFAPNKKALKDAKLNPSECAYRTETEIDYGGEAYTESVEKIKEA